MSLAGDEQILEMSSANIVLLFEWRKRNVIFLHRGEQVCDVRAPLSALHKLRYAVVEAHLRGYRPYLCGPHLVALALVGKEYDPAPLERCEHLCR